jgi:hypothetical protein
VDASKVPAHFAGYLEDGGYASEVSPIPDQSEEVPVLMLSKLRWQQFLHSPALCYNGDLLKHTVAFTSAGGRT